MLKCNLFYVLYSTIDLNINRFPVQLILIFYLLISLTLFLFLFVITNKLNSNQINQLFMMPNWIIHRSRKFIFTPYYTQVWFASPSHILVTSTRRPDQFTSYKNAKCKNFAIQFILSTEVKTYAQNPLIPNIWSLHIKPLYILSKTELISFLDKNLVH